MKYKVKTKDCHLIVRAKASFGEAIDEKALDAFARTYLRGFLKPRLVKRNQVEYTGPVGLSLYERLRKPISKRDFLFIIEQIVVAVQKIQANSLDMAKVVLDIHNVYINEVTKEIQFLYVPTKKESKAVDVVQFVESIVYSVTPAAENDTEFVSRFIYFLKGQKGFVPEKVEQFIIREDRSVVNTIKKQNAGQSGFMTSKRQHYHDHYDKKNQEFEDEATGLLEEDEATGLLDEEEATGLLEEDEATGLLGDMEEMGTALLDQVHSTHFPTLFRVLTEESVSINKPVFRLGKERSYVDYFVTNNNAVSRSHADIVTRGDRYFVIDLNSKNHTYINDQLLPVQCETEIRAGDKLRLGNEEFIFNV